MALKFDFTTFDGEAVIGAYAIVQGGFMVTKKLPEAEYYITYPVMIFRSKEQADAYRTDGRTLPLRSQHIDRFKAAGFDPEAPALAQVYGHLKAKLAGMEGVANVQDA